VGRIRLFTTADSSARMALVRQHGTNPELLVRAACTDLRMRYTTRNRDLPGSPDLANRARAWAIFVHGCYWHRHGGCVKASSPKSNAQFWTAKFERNVERDRATRAALVRRGYRVLTLWQCEVESTKTLAKRLRLFARVLGYS